MNFETLFQDRFVLGLMASGAGLAGVAAFNLLRGGGESKKKESALPDGMKRSESLEHLAERAEWCNNEKKKQGVKVKDLVPLWRDPSGLLDDNYNIDVRLSNVEDFYHMLVTHGFWFRQGRYIKQQRAVVIQILELLDSYHPTKSVVQRPNTTTDTDTQWGQERFSVLTKVTLLAHSLNVVEMGVSHLIETKEIHRIPDAIIALMAHDIGKLPIAGSSQIKGTYGSGEHPVLSAKILKQMHHFKDLPRQEEILKAVLGHHLQDPPERSLQSIVQIADRAARRDEIQIHGETIEAPSWIATAPAINPTLMYSSERIPGLFTDKIKIKDPDETMESPLKNIKSMGVLGNMTNPGPSAITALSDAQLQKAEESFVNEYQGAEEFAFNQELIEESEENINEENNEDTTKKGSGFLSEVEEDFVGDKKSKESKDQHIQIQSEEPMEKSNTEPTAEEIIAQSIYGIDDPVWERVCHWIDHDVEEDQEIDAKLIQQTFRIKQKRADHIYQALLDHEKVGLAEEIETQPELPLKVTIETHSEQSPPIKPLTAAEMLEAMAPTQTPVVEAQKPIINQDIPIVDISAWFNPGQFKHMLESRIDKGLRRPKANLNEKFDISQIVESKDTSSGTFFVGVTSKHHTWVNIMALRQMAAEQLLKRDRKGAQSLFENSGSGGDKSLQDMVLRAIVNYFQVTGEIDVALLPVDSSFYSVNCEIVLEGGTKQSNRRMVPFHWTSFYGTWNEVKTRQLNYPFISRIEEIRVASVPQGIKRIPVLSEI